jgi:serine/threonine protein kinase
LIPSTILFIASDAIDIASQIRLIDGDFCPEFDRWLELRKSGLEIDFRRIQRVGFDLRCLEEYVLNLSGFEERSIICNSDKVPNQIYHRTEDQFLILMKSIPLSENIQKSDIENEIEKMINLRHHCIIASIGFVFPINSGTREELKIIRLYLEGYSLWEMISVNLIWWTSTVKAKAIGGIVLALRFAHSFWLVHGHLTANNILFDSDHCIQIINFHPISLEVGESEEGTQLGDFSGTRRALKRDIQAFVSILFQLLFGHPPQGD